MTKTACKQSRGALRPTSRREDNKPPVQKYDKTAEKHRRVCDAAAACPLESLPVPSDRRACCGRARAPCPSCRCSRSPWTTSSLRSSSSSAVEAASGRRRAVSPPCSEVPTGSPFSNHTHTRARRLRSDCNNISDVIKTFFKTKTKTFISRPRPSLVFKTKTKTLHLKNKTKSFCDVY